MNPVPASVGAPRSPQVNLLPPDVAERRAANRTRRAIIALMVLFVIAVGGVWYFTLLLRQQAESALAEEQALTTQKQAELATYAYLAPLRAQVDNAEAARFAAGQVDILWTDQLNALFATFPSTATLDQFVATPTTPLAPYATDGTIFGVVDFGSVTFSGTSSQPLDTATLQNAIDALPGFERATIDSVVVTVDAESTDPKWSFSGSARVTINALSNRVVTTQEIVPVEDEASADDETTDGSEG